MDDPLFRKSLVHRLYADVQVTRHGTNRTVSDPHENTDTRTDFTLRLSDGDIHLHKLLLVTVSPYFKCMLSQPFAESTSGVLCMPSVDVATMTLLVKYVYTGSASLSADTVLDLLVLADYLQIAPLVAVCCQQARRHLTPSSCLLLFAVAEACGLTDLSRRALQYASRHSQALLKDPSLLRHMTADTLTSLLHHRQFGRHPNTRPALIEAVYEWVRSDPVSRVSHLTRLLRVPELCMLLHQHPELCDVITLHHDHRLQHGDREFDEMRVQENLETAMVVFIVGGEHCGTVAKITECLTLDKSRCNLSGDKWSFMIIKPDIETSLAQRNVDYERAVLRDCQPTKMTADSQPEDMTTDCEPTEMLVASRSTEMTVAIGEKSDVCTATADVSAIHCGEMLTQCKYNCGDDKLPVICSRFRIKNLKLNALLNDAYEQRCRLVENLPDRDPSAFRVPVQNIREEIIKESEPRKYSAIACFEETNTFVVLGGHGRTSLFSSVHEYHVSTNTWSTLPSLPWEVQGGGAAVIDDTLYFVAGATQDGYLDQLWRLSPNQQSWEQLPSLPVARCHVAVAALNGALYVTGGRTEAASITSDRVGSIHTAARTTSDTACFKYDPRAQEWTQLGSLTHPRSYHGAAVCCDNLYVMGGYDGSYWLDTTERYDADTDTWIQVGSMLSSRSSFGCVCLPSLTADNCSTESILVIGGFTGYRSTNQCESYSPRTNSWHMRPSLRAERVGAVAAVLALKRWRNTQEHVENIDIT